jgi:predicted acyltransferase (DUF342 family)
MLGVPMAGYLLLLLLFFLFFSASLYFGYREWRQPSDAIPLAMDVDYIREENYFGRSFRAKMREWLAETQPNGVAVGAHGERGAASRRRPAGGEQLLRVPGGRIGNGQEAEIIYSEGDLTLAEGSIFRREIYCQGRVRTEAGVQLQSVAADGDMILGAENNVARWVDAQGVIVIRGGTVVGSRASSLASIELERGVCVQSLYAPMVCTARMRAEAHSGRDWDGPDSAFPAAQSGAGGNGSDPPAVPRFLEGVRCTRLDPGTWLVQDDLKLPAGSRIEDNLIVKGVLTSGSQCVFFRDVKALRIELGERNHALGNLAAEDRLQMGEGSFVARNIAAGSNVRLATGVRVGRPGELAAVSAAGEIIMEQDVTVCGKLTASRWVRTV